MLVKCSCTLPSGLIVQDNLAADVCSSQVNTSSCTSSYKVVCSTQLDAGTRQSFTCVSLALVVAHRLVVDGQRAKLQHVAALLVGACATSNGSARLASAALLPSGGPIIQEQRGEDGRSVSLRRQTAVARPALTIVAGAVADEQELLLQGLLHQVSSITANSAPGLRWQGNSHNSVHHCWNSTRQVPAACACSRSAVVYSDDLL
jgi:hypothetical protein